MLLRSGRILLPLLCVAQLHTIISTCQQQGLAYSQLLIPSSGVEARRILPLHAENSRLTRMMRCESNGLPTMQMSDGCNTRRSVVRILAGAALPLFAPFPVFGARRRLDEYEEEGEVLHVGSLEKFDAHKLYADTCRFMSMRPDARPQTVEPMAWAGGDADSMVFAVLATQLMAQESTTAPAKYMAAPPSKVGKRELPGAPWFVQDITDRVTELIRRYPTVAAGARTGSDRKTSLLHWAAREGLLEACRLLVEAGASPTAACDAEFGGKSAIQLAMANSGSGGINSGSTQADVVRFLVARSKGAPKTRRRARSAQLWFEK